MGFFLLLLVAVVCAVLSGQVATSKGHDAGGWMLGGLLLGPLVLLATLGLPDLKLRKYVRLLAEHQGALTEEEVATAARTKREEVDAQRKRILGLK